ncbi:MULTISPECIES: hypothetical protein [unclassified Shinella]|uniref:hypothetical protein n=1 Tax=unclassified Shinella TaxID=2643062 RepID=UPI00234E8A03|nr:MULTISPECIES: hypothetical protein [unclassified Shinella]MCO5148516.1 hypothetical protein [Shinella sp.]MDC7264586.1 hypothetical protein [Shinella sp. HY16]MDC7271483.1 hypothetical protein [Shinella sp. YZ44]
MKSPWKIISSLISRRQAAEEQVSVKVDGATSSADTSDAPEAPPYIPVLAPDETPEGKGASPPLVSLIDSGSAPGSDAVPDDRPRAPAERQFVGAPVDKPSNGLEQEAPLRTSRPRPKQGNRRKRSPAKDATGMTMRPMSRDIPERQQADPFQIEVAGVDEEIRALTRKLTEKLRHQNAQLRALLSRFGGP